jgi:hypothetical protein
MANLLSEKFKNEYIAVIITFVQTTFVGTAGNIFLQLRHAAHQSSAGESEDCILNAFFQVIGSARIITKHLIL